MASANQEPSAFCQSTVRPLIEKLTSSDAKLREEAAHSINALIDDQASRRLFLKEKLVRWLVEHVSGGKHRKPTDNDCRVVNPRLKGWKLLEQLAAKEDRKFGVHLYRMGILKPMDTEFELLMKRLITLPEPEPSESQDKHIWDASEPLAQLALSLAQASDEIVSAMTKLHNVPGVFMNLVIDSKTPEHLRVKGAQCLAILSKGNVLLAKKIKKSGGADLFPENKSLKDIVLCELQHNLFRAVESTAEDKAEGERARKEGDLSILPFLGESLSDYIHYNAPANGHGPVGEPPSSGTEHAVRISLVTLAAIAGDAVQDYAKTEVSPGSARAAGAQDQQSGDDEDMDTVDDVEEDDIEDDEDGIEDDVEDAGIDGDEEMTEMMELVDVPSDQDMDEMDERRENNNVKSAGKRVSFISYLVDSITPLVLGLAVSQYSTTLNLPILPSLALSTLCKIAWTMSAARELMSAQEWKRWAAQAQNVWNRVVSPVLASNTADLELANRITNIAWALASSCGGQIEILEGEEQKFVALYQATTNLASIATSGVPALTATPTPTLIKNKLTEHDDEATTLSVKAIGVLGRLALRQKSLDLNRKVGLFLLVLIENTSRVPIPDLVEALNQLFDVYSDMAFDYDEPVFWNEGDGLIGRLEAALPNVLRMHKRVDMRVDNELREQAVFAGRNLKRFIAYKKKEKQGYVEPGAFSFEE